MQTVLVVVHLFLAVGVIGLVLMQHGKGADAGAAFGSGSSGTVFGAAGSANFLSRATALLATLFFLTSLGMGWFSMQSVEKPGLMTEEAKPAIEIPVSKPEPMSEVPAIPGATSGSSVEVPVVSPVTTDSGEKPKVAE
ncbi:preprotein translocase subunit SecG [Sedimenticola sp.]|uniref:preprotein translocase subunit SecG n=1 Tax=Sedimenticola sp. TaxID=1940285 RepID=UPI003D149658